MFLPRIVIAFILIFVALPAYSACRAPSYTPSELQPMNPHRINQALVSSSITKASNYYRCRKGKATLQTDHKLTSVAATRALQMKKRDKLAHLAGTGLLTQYSRHGVKTRVYAENLAESGSINTKGQFISEINASKCQYRLRDKSMAPIVSYAELANSVVARWYKSRSHRRNLLHNKVRSVGSAAALSRRPGHPCGIYYISQNFAD